jgi:hypothetical protein
MSILDVSLLHSVRSATRASCELALTSISRHLKNFVCRLHFESSFGHAFAITSPDPAGL